MRSGGTLVSELNSEQTRKVHVILAHLSLKHKYINYIKLSSSQHFASSDVGHAVFLILQ